ncbi:UNVERIFIED_CONTAM: hypothetical protein K2H54_037591 [Gekko kuhli]
MDAATAGNKEREAVQLLAEAEKRSRAQAGWANAAPAGEASQKWGLRGLKGKMLRTGVSPEAAAFHVARGDRSVVEWRPRPAHL